MSLWCGYVRTLQNVILWQRVPACSCFFSLGFSCAQILAVQWICVFMELENHWENQELWLGWYGLCYPFAFHDSTFEAKSPKLGCFSIRVVGKVWNSWLCVGFGKLFWLCCIDVVKFFQVWMYEYFGVGPKIRGEVIEIFPKFLHWLPKYHLSMPSRRSLEIWCMVIENLIVDDVSPFLLCGIFGVWLWFGLFLILGFFCDF